MSDEEVLAVSRMCTSYEVWACDKCPLKGRDVCREEINRRVLEMAEKYLEHRKNIELIRALIETAAECGARMKGGAG
jgi:Zn-finger protein